MFGCSNFGNPFLNGLPSFPNFPNFTSTTQYGPMLPNGFLTFNVQSKIYVKIDGHWFDLSTYNNHPGGFQILKKYHLQDATQEFNRIRGHGEGYVQDLLEKYEIHDPKLLDCLEIEFNNLNKKLSH
jgi:hypothetical protein